ncbi:putative ABC transport system permease protein [Haloferula luteola]|uniref:Putative ABC transport system permease protein n=1 Tax=Haloferula luteola TaxID=595692 RepID=A0A840V3H2_9BACT|nr:ABC transporter permease [Haloferula luteola]MBB5352545.1 putative ABC transport system permease protein [Haloferula luteola]
MSLWKLILTNLRRHRVRTAIGATGIALGVATLLSVVGLLGGAVKMFEKILRSDAEMVVFERNVSDLFFSNVPETLVEELEEQSFVKEAQPVLFTIIAAPDRPVVTCFGIRASDGRLEKAEWLSGGLEGFLDDGRGVVLGERAADFLKATAGDEVELGQDRYPVAGVVRMENGFENGGVFMPLKECQRAFHKEGGSSVVTVALAEGHEPREVKAWIDAHHDRLTALENEEFSRSYSQFRILKTTAWVVGGCAFLLGGLSVTNTMILSVFSRIRELAVLRVCGFSRGQLARMILGESLALSSIGVLAGWLLSIGGLRLLKVLPALQGYIEPQVGMREVLGAVVLAMLTGVGGALYPAIHAAKLKPAEALRFE